MDGLLKAGLAVLVITAGVGGLGWLLQRAFPSSKTRHKTMQNPDPPGGDEQIAPTPRARLVAKNLPNPDAWGDDVLADFIEASRINTLATFQKLPSEYALLRDIDELLLELAENLDDPKDQRVPFFIFLGHGTYRASVRLAMSGQLPPTYMALRGCVEFAVYGHYIHRNPTTFEVWRKRGDSEEDQKAARREFTWRRVVDCLEEHDSHEATVARGLYERALELGAHPNEGALFSALTIDEDKGTVGFNVAYLQGDSIQLRLALKSVAQSGMLFLRVMRLVFPELFESLSLSERVERISRFL